LAKPEFGASSGWLEAGQLPMHRMIALSDQEDNLEAFFQSGARLRLTIAWLFSARRVDHFDRRL
jgi:hypothetical protein